MKKMNKKGFTIVELVIVIAIIAILATVLIPTFSNVIGKANESKCLQAAKTKFEEAYALDYADGTLDGKDGTANIGDNYSYDTTNKVAKYSYKADGYKAEYDGSKWTVSEVAETKTTE